MARIRSVHPDICTSETMAALPAEVERTYVRLWTHMDDHGRCIDNVKLIAAALYPLNDDMTVEVVDKHLDLLCANGHLVGYEVAGTRCLEVCEWTKYQHPQRKTDSRVPVREASATRTRCVQPNLFGSGRGSMEMYAQEGRGDCADTSATVPPNPRRLDEIRSGLKAIG